MTDPTAPLSYRKDVDGLRAIAILPVLLYHANLGISGGFVGVDVFFVISGFLITAIIHNDLVLGRFSFLQFWERRARRILPALIVVALSILVAGWFILMPRDYDDLGKASVFQSLFLANVYSHSSSGYFDIASAEKPLLHMWSLAVEEQFYFVIPVLLWLLFRYRKTRPRRSTLVLLGVLTAASFALSTVGVVWKPSATFYLLPTRAWELLVGALLAVAPRGSSVRNKLVDELGAGLGLVLVLIAVFLYSDDTKFPGPAALLPVAGAAMVIFFGRTGSPGTLVARVLSTKPLVFVGLISYSLYLWHWPIIVFAKHLSLEPLGILEMLGLVVLSLAVSVLSWKFIETPFRRKKLATGRKIFVWTGAGLAALVVAGMSIALLDGFRDRWPEEVLAYQDAREDKSFRIELSPSDAKQGNFFRMGTKDTAVESSFLIWGDSHAMAVAAAFDKYLADQGLAGVGATHSSTAPVLNWYRTNPWGLGPTSPVFAEAVLDYVVSRKIRNVVLAGSWASYIGKGEDGFQEALLKTIGALELRGAQVWLLLDVPRPLSDVPRLLTKTTLNHLGLVRYLRAPQDTKLTDGFRDEVLEQVRTLGGIVLNPKSAFLSASQDYYLIEKDGQALYFDNHHLSTFGALQIMLPFLETAVGDDFADTGPIPAASRSTPALAP